MIRRALVGCAVIVFLLVAGAALAVPAGAQPPDGRINVTTERFSVVLDVEGTDVAPGESATARFSAVNYVTGDRPLTVQVVITPPAGMEVTAPADAAGEQYARTFSVDPGASRTVDVRMVADEPGTYDVEARVIYYLGEDRSNATVRTATIPVRVERRVVTGIAGGVGGALDRAVGVLYSAKPANYDRGMSIVFGFGSAFALFVAAMAFGATVELGRGEDVSTEMMLGFLLGGLVLFGGASFIGFGFTAFVLSVALAVVVVLVFLVARYRSDAVV